MSPTAPGETDTHSVTRRVAVGPALLALVARSVRRLLRLPSAIVPAVVMPGFFVIAFSGSFDGVTKIEGYPTESVIDWVAAFSVLQSCAFAGIGAAGSIASDIESRFVDRLLVSPMRRSLIILGPLGQGAIRALIPITVVLTISFIEGAHLPGGLLGFAMVVVGGISWALLAGALGVWLVLWIRDIRALVIVQVVAFMGLFPSTGQMPLELMDGWLKSVARVNPGTQLLELTRQGFIGEVSWGETWPGLVVVAVGLALFFSLAIGRLRQLDS